MSTGVKAGMKLGRYEIRSQLGVGGMGEVYLAFDSRLNRTVAIKILPSDIAAVRDRMNRFIQEAQAASALNHPNIITIYEIDQIDSTYLIATEFVEGETLRQRLLRNNVTIVESLDVAIQIVSALVAAHEVGIIHRDIKPENVMIRRDGIVKVLDFGLAKLAQNSEVEIDSEAPTRAQVDTAAGVVMGTAAYMSPEQARGVEIDTRTDIWSVGAVLYELITHHRPFTGATSSDVIAKILEREPLPINRYNPKVPEALEWLIMKALARDREERYQTARELLADLKRLRRRLEVDSETRDSGNADGELLPRIVSGETQSTSSPIASTVTNVPTQVTSSAEYLINEVKAHKTVALLIVAGVVVIGILAVYKVSQLKFRQSTQARKITRLTSIGRVGATSISPDGKYVVYSALNDSGQSSIWVRHIATLSNVEIVPAGGSEVNYSAPAFSRDGNYVYYLRGEGARPRVLYQVAVLGGSSKRILEDVNGPVSFSPDGKRFTFERRYLTGEDAVMIANVDGSGEQKLAVRKHPDFFLPGAVWSPDGNTIACPIGGFEGGYYRSVAVVDVNGGGQRPLTQTRWIDVESIAWLADSSGLIATASEHRGDPFQLWEISYPAGISRNITDDVSDYRSVGLTADSSVMVAVLSEATANLSAIPNGQWSDPHQLTSSNDNGRFGITFTPDGRIIYQSTVNGNSDLWMVDIDGQNQKQITNDEFAERGPEVTPDGRYIVYDSDKGGTIQVWRINIDGSNAKLLTPSRGMNADNSGSWVFYTSFDVGGFSIWKVSIDGGNPVQVSESLSGVFANLPAISPDGKLIACYYVDDKTRMGKIGLIPIDGGELVKSFDFPAAARAPLHPVRWTADGRALTYIVNRGGVSNIWIQPISGDPPRQLTEFKTDRIFAFDWSADGKWLACSRGPEQRDVVLIRDFR
jgi:eukaryotic-like serine/threonine-protein kinase